ncbi:MAG: D-tyrosyl-tRNA(Tyr) deacylase [Gammaproteobacteria bacterium]|nr:D-tyrosyl-tRNA(Tyr) deacylase [Gammaproteobacteria bacterium]NNF62264.1 D-tyrosyl-tRNA(Tyr) deacylase [Gammaproteobacteria bacterium]NNM21061.1 D-tyrosyl-tRNA(Tyr) deacylase [Gammaproteobacteria bacterium]
MIALLQRVGQAEVRVGDRTVAAIGTGLLVLAAVERGDTSQQARRLAERICGYRVFPDGTGRMNLSVIEHGGEVLLVPQFTLAADTRKGMRASFATAAEPEVGQALFAELAAAVNSRAGKVALGEFGADMAVSLVNEGPVTFWLHAPPP